MKTLLKYCYLIGLLVKQIDMKKMDKDMINDIVIRMPGEFMIEDQKELVLKILLERRERIMSLNKKEGV
ncbi:hypothetical protein [Halanaerobium sp.]|uniref:hypothetical protein n=1 Tax=Halanaerobium sp. TaxID=1895664 RepID=UPI000DE76011|nr:hypothetical protein [Halanaerobium sp.]PUU91466.1 MAG: hypothetical protein CI949_1979 [Halanaerobium sp.]